MYQTYLLCLLFLPYSDTFWILVPENSLKWALFGQCYGHFLAIVKVLPGHCQGIVKGIEEFQVTFNWALYLIFVKKISNNFELPISDFL